jgi:anti-sigma regulatory factor (Ser/Thr protein kinase)
VELTISASPFELAGLRRAARDALGEVPTQVADDMLLALDEAATNAILHGSDGGDPIQVAVRVRDTWVEASVLDHGPAKPPRPLSTTDRRSGGGWGLWLLRCLVDEVRLERVERGTRVTLRRRVQSEPSPNAFCPAPEPEVDLHPPSSAPGWVASGWLGLPLLHGA